MANAESGMLFKAAVAASSAGHTIANGYSNSTVSRRAYSPIVLAGFVRAIEVALIIVVGLVSARWSVPNTDFAVVNVIGVSLLALVAFQAADIYQLPMFRGHGKPYLWLTFAWSVVILTTLALSHFARLDEGLSGLWLGIYYVAGLIILIAFRCALSLLVRRLTAQGRFDRHTVIVGGGERGEALIDQLAAQPDSDLRILGVFDDRNDDRSPTACHGFPKLGTVDDLVEFARHTRVDLVLVALPITAEERVLQMLKKLWILPLDIRLVAQGNKLRFRPRSYSYIGNVPVFDVIDRPTAHWDVVTKWLFDKIVGTLALVCTAPIMVLIALAIKFESNGPILFKQRRHGFNNNIFDVFKFRSMYVEYTDAMARNVVTRNDPRVTRVGRFIRKTSLDELPQLFNVVFIGNMSVVGPRPHAVYGTAEGLLYDDAIDGYFARHRVKPGVTGWAQINGWRGATDSNEKIQRRVEHDLYYIENWSILFDIWILIRTPFALIRSENAY